MGKASKIEWTDHTFNPWWGCTQISPGCDHCYAEAWDRRLGGAHWGVHAPRRIMSDAYWRQPLRWNATPPPDGRRWRVFCASMADVFDTQAPPGQRERLWDLIRATPNLEWLLLTKRPQNFNLLPPGWVKGLYQNVRLGVTVENQIEAERRIPRLVDIPVRLAPFLSCEPLLGPLDLSPWLWRKLDADERMAIRVATDCHPEKYRRLAAKTSRTNAIGWIIVGGESGPKARPMEVEWATRIARQCRDADVPFFMKQGSQANWPNFKDFDSFPRELKIREFPK